MIPHKAPPAHFLARQATTGILHARPRTRPALPPIPIALSPVFSRPVLPFQPDLAIANGGSRRFSTSSVVSALPGSKVKEKILGVAAALKAQGDSGFEVRPEIFDEFSLEGRVGVVSGGNGGLGLEMAVALCEAGAKIHCLDLPSSPSSDFSACVSYVEKLQNGSSLSYHATDVTDQNRISSLIVDDIAGKEGRLDLCVAAAGILGPAEGESCLTYSRKDWERVMRVNLDGVFYTCQAAAKGMVDTGCKGGSIVMIASMSGSITNKDQPWVAYNTSKSGVLQMARSMACELGKENIRVNTISPGHIYTKMTAALLDVKPETGELWSSSNPLGRLGQVHELRGVVTWLASDASSFCTGSDILVSGGHHSW